MIAVEPLWMKDVESISKELIRISMMFEKLKKNTLDDNLRELAEELMIQSYTLGKYYLYLGNRDAIYPSGDEENEQTK